MKKTDSSKDKEMILPDDLCFFSLPYGKASQTLSVGRKHLADVLESSAGDYVPETDGTDLIRSALAHPLGSPRLRDLAKGKKKITVIASDHTRPVPSRLIMPLLLSEIREGNPDAEITILIATGLHRTTTADELRNKLGQEIVERETIVVHDCDDPSSLVTIGTLPSGGTLTISRLAAEADLLVAEGFIEPHFFAGFSGGRKSVLPGVASRSAVMYNHNAGFIADPAARTGILENNPIHRDMVYAARKAGLAFIVNVVINAAKEPVFAAAGDMEEAHRAGVDFLLAHCRAKAAPADIVVTTNGGYPLDQNVYQAVKGMTAAEAAVKEGGVIVMLAECADGHGGRSFYETFRDEKDLSRMMRTFLSRSPEETIIDQWQSQIFARVLLRARVIFVSSCPDGMVRDLHMIPAHSAQEALEEAVRMTGDPDYRVTVIPDGVSVIVEPDRPEASAPLLRDDPGEKECPCPGSGAVPDTGNTGPGSARSRAGDRI